MSITDLIAVVKDLLTTKSELVTTQICLKTHHAREPSLAHRALSANSQEDILEYGFQAQEESSPSVKSKLMKAHLFNSLLLLQHKAPTHTVMLVKLPMLLMAANNAAGLIMMPTH